MPRRSRRVRDEATLIHRAHAFTVLAWWTLVKRWMRLGLGARHAPGAPGASTSQGNLRSRDDQHETDDRPDRESLAEQKYTIKERKRGRQIVRKRCPFFTNTGDEPVVEHKGHSGTDQAERNYRQHRLYTGQLARRGDNRYRKRQQRPNAECEEARGARRNTFILVPQLDDEARRPTTGRRAKKG